MNTQYDYDNLKNGSEPSNLKVETKYEGDFTYFENRKYQSVLVLNTSGVSTLTQTNLASAPLPSENLNEPPFITLFSFKKQANLPEMVVILNVLQGAQSVSKLGERAGECSGVVGSAAGVSILIFHIM